MAMHMRKYCGALVLYASICSFSRICIPWRTASLRLWHQCLGRSSQAVLDAESCRTTRDATTARIQASLDPRHWRNRPSVPILHCRPSTAAWNPLSESLWDLPSSSAGLQEDEQPCRHWHRRACQRGAAICRYPPTPVQHSTRDLGKSKPLTKRSPAEKPSATYLHIPPSEDCTSWAEACNQRCFLDSNSVINYRAELESCMSIVSLWFRYGTVLLPWERMETTAADWSLAMSNSISPVLGLERAELLIWKIMKLASSSDWQL